MACRDYDEDSGYDTWLKRGRERLDSMSQMLRDFRRIAEKEELAIPEAAASWFEQDAAGKTGPLSKKNFDAAAQALCALCRAAEGRGTAIPAAIVPWWTEHKAADDHAAELAQGLATTPIHADFWAVHAARLALTREVPGIPLETAIKALEKAGLRVLRRGKTIAMANDTQQILLPRQDPVNPFALGGILNRLGIDDEAFRKLL